MYLNSGSCYECRVSLPYCQYCLDISTCSQCQSGWYLSGGTGACVACDSAMGGCLQCTSASQCLTCSGGYYLNILSSTATDCVACY